MKYKQLGRTGLYVSEICLGTMTFGGNADAGMWKAIGSLPQADVDKLMDDAERGSNAVISIDLEAQEIRGPDGGVVKFELDAFRKHCMLNGLDDIGLTLQKQDGIKGYETSKVAEHPWI